MRVANWQAALLEVFESAQGRRFRWGRHDCCQFVARCAEAVTGEKRHALFPRYRTRLSAEEILAGHGGIEGLLTRAFGDPVHPSRASAGDVVLIDMGQGPQPAICMGLNSYAPGMRNLTHRPTLGSTASKPATAAWVL